MTVTDPASALFTALGQLALKGVVPGELSQILQPLIEQGITLEEIVRLAGDGESLPAAGPAPAKTLSEYIDQVEATLDRNTRRTWRTHFERLRKGIPPQCDCLCDQCLDTRAGCDCDCSRCYSTRIEIPARGHQHLSKGSRILTTTDIDSFVVVARRMSQKKAARDNIGRARRGLTPKPTHGHGGGENAVTALRHLLGKAVLDGYQEQNPAMAVKKPRRNESVRRALRPHELEPYLKAVASGGDDPELDTLMVWFHLETGARRAGGLNLRVGDLLMAQQLVKVFEKFGIYRDQPVSRELLAALLRHAISRGGERCRPGSREYDPTAPVFYYAKPAEVRSSRSATPRKPHPLTSRRYDTVHLRLQRTLDFANEVSFTVHGLRYTGAVLVQRIAGTEVARLFLGHGSRSVTQDYAKSWEQELAQAVSVLTGAPHPLAKPTEPA